MCGGSGGGKAGMLFTPAVQPRGGRVCEAGKVWYGPTCPTVLCVCVCVYVVTAGKWKGSRRACRCGKAVPASSLVAQPSSSCLSPSSPRRYAVCQQQMADTCAKYSAPSFRRRYRDIFTLVATPRLRYAAAHALSRAALLSFAMRRRACVHAYRGT